MSTFPVAEICFRTGWSPSAIMSASRSYPSGVEEGSASRPQADDSNPFSPGISSLSSSSTTNHQLFTRSVDEVKSVWDFPGVEKHGNSIPSSSQTWKCCWCKSTFKGWNATKVMNHLSKTALGRIDIKVCNGNIPKETLAFFKAYRIRANSYSSVKRQHSEALTDVIADNQTSIAVAFGNKRVRSSLSGSANNPFVLTDDGGVEASNATRLTSAIADFIFCKGLAFSAVEGDHFLQILKLARLVPSNYRPPTRKVISTELLNLSYDSRLKRYMEALSIDSTLFGLSFFGDGATVHGMPLMNILASGHYEPSAILAIVDCKFCSLFVCLFLIIRLLLIYIVLCFHCFIFTGTNHLVAGKKKDATFIASLFDPWIEKLDPEGLRVDCVFFDGASNVQKAGRLLAAKYPRIHVQTCAAHSVSLFFSDVCKKLWQVRLMLVNYRRLYRLFGSGSMHSPYALFCQQSKNFNGGRKVGLLRASDTRMAGHAYAQVRMLRLKDALLATITSAGFVDLKLKGFPKKVVAYLQNPDMWEATFVLQRCLFPMIRVLRLGDKSACGGMSKIVYFVHQTDDAIQNSMDLLRDLKYFRTANPTDANDVDGVEADDGSDSDNDAIVYPEEDDSDSEAIEETLVVQRHLGEQISDIWKVRREKLITPLSIAAWFCSPEAVIRKDVLARGTGQHRQLIDSVIAKIYYPIQKDELSRTIQTFWREFDDFQTGRGVCYTGLSDVFSSPYAENEPHIWHKMFTKPYTAVFGYVACRVCSKPLGCGAAERAWGALKHLKNGKRSHLSAEKSERQTTVYGASCMEKSRAIQSAEEKQGLVLESRWTDADIAYQEGVLDDWSPQVLVAPVVALVLAPVVAPVLVADPVVPPVAVRARLFKAWIEDDWEWAAMEKKDEVTKRQLLVKYHGLHWLDENDVLIVAKCLELEWRSGRHEYGYHLIGVRDSDGVSDYWRFHEVVDLIAAYDQPAYLNVTIEYNEEERAANFGRVEEILIARMAAAEEKKKQAAQRKQAAELRKLKII